jgi:DNA modification methylase
VVTSPPYYGLRDYGTALWDGGDANCQHTFARQDERLMRGSNGELGKNCTSWTHRDATPPRLCSCGARRIDRQIGLEPTPDEYLATMVAVFREVRRVLRKDGTLWLNIGDSYVSGATGSLGNSFSANARGQHAALMRPSKLGAGKPKDLLMMPARLALALQADGWWVRSDIIWHKPNPMPESVTDRCVSAHEHVFMLTKSARYFFDMAAIAEATAQPFGEAKLTGQHKADAGGFTTNGHGNSSLGSNQGAATRACRNVWTIPTHPYAQAHFATYPPQLAERCIRAGTSERGACSQCGKPWQRIAEVSYTDAHRGMVGNQRKAVTDERVMHAGRENDVRMDKHTTTTGWSPACACNAGDPVPCKVLDPFAGAGTTLLVADRLQRDAIGIELNPDYTTMAMQRCRDDAPLFTAFPPADDPEEARMADLFADAEYAQLSPPKPDAFRNSGRYVNQGLAPSNGQPEAAD